MAGQFKDKRGREYGRWTILHFDRRVKRKTFWWCLCSCGTEAAIEDYSMTSGASRSCGCWQDEKERATRIFTDAQTEAIQSRYSAEGAGLLAQEFGVLPEQVIHKAQKLRLRSVNRHRHRGLSMRKSNQTVDLGFFDQWSPDMAYILGYVWADGCLQCDVDGTPRALRFLCTLDDAELLRQIATAMRFGGSIRTGRSHPTAGRNGRSYISRPTAYFSVNSRHIVDVLRDRHGLSARKSYLNLPFPEVPAEYLSHFARGNFDGDGCVSFSQGGNRRRAVACWLGSPRWIIGLAERIAAAAAVPTPTYAPRDGLLKAAWHAKSDLKALRDWLYAGATIWLARKREKFDETVRAFESVRPLPRRPRKTDAAGARYVRQHLDQPTLF